MDSYFTFLINWCETPIRTPSQYENLSAEQWSSYQSGHDTNMIFVTYYSIYSLTFFLVGISLENRLLCTRLKYNIDMRIWMCRVPLFFLPWFLNMLLVLKNPFSVWFIFIYSHPIMFIMIIWITYWYLIAPTPGYVDLTLLLASNPRIRFHLTNLKKAITTLCCLHIFSF